MTQIIGIMLVKNEDMYVEQAIRNITGFCDRIIVCDNYSSDQTWSILQSLTQEFSQIELQQIETVAQSQTAIEEFAGTATWVFGVDGDEIYDPAGLAAFRAKILSGVFDQDFVIFGNVLNCDRLDLVKKTAQGYLAPPCRSMTKLYNFAAIESWVGCTERFHGGKIIFKPGYHDLLRRMYHEEHTWEASDYRCLHTVFLKRSSAQNNLAVKTRLNPESIRYYQGSHNFFQRGAKYLLSILKIAFHNDYKYEKYHRGPQVSQDVAAFFPKK
jgi:glycosyltransferase involved in cell wall biosynthesis